MTVQEMMTRSAACCFADDNLNAAARLMWEHDCGAIPVIDGDRRVIGMITDRDICMAAYTRGAPIADIPVSEVMSRQAFVCRPGDSVERAEQGMRDHQVRRLPVVDDTGRMVGILSMSDLVRGAAPSRTRGKNGMSTQVMETMAAVCEPRPQRSMAV